MTVFGFDRDLRALDGEAGPLDEAPVRLGPEVAEVHVDPEPVRLHVARLVVGAHRGEEEAAGPEPAPDPTEQVPLLVPRHMRQRVERHDGVEACRLEVERGHVGLRERGARDVAACRRDLRRGNVDPGHGPALRECSGHRDAGAAAQFQDVATGRNQLQREGQVPTARRRWPEVAPGEIALGDRVIALRDDPFRVHRSGVSARR